MSKTEVWRRNKDLRKIVQRAKKQGCRVEQTSRGDHLVVITPNGGRITLGGSLSDHRSLKNAKARLRRVGVYI